MSVDVFDRGHKQGFVHGYQMAMQDIRSMLAGVTDTIPRDDVESIMARYNEIFQGLDNPNQVIEGSEVIQEVQA